MKHSNRSTGMLVGCVILIIAGCVFAQDWPQWRGPGRDGKVTGFAAPQTWPKQLTQKWKSPVGSGDSTPALVGDKLFVSARQGSDEVILCLDATNGKELWQDKYAAPAVSGPAGSHPGPRSSPAVADGKVLVLGASGTLSCLDAASGKVLWRKDDFPNWPKFYTAMSPIVVNGLCMAQLGGSANAAIVAYDLASGDQKWKSVGEGPGYASPVLLTIENTPMIVTLTEKSIVAISVADGKVLWQAPFAPQGMAYNAATPIVDGQTIIYTGQGRGTKAVRIEKDGENFVAKDLWANAQLGTQFNTPILKDGLLYGLSDKGAFFCLNAKTGQAAWTDTTRRGNFGAMLDAGTVILALTNKSELAVFEPTDKAYTELARIKVADKETYAHPILAGNRIFVRDQDSVTLWTLE